MEPSAGTLTTPSFSDLDITNLDIFFSCLCANTNIINIQCGHFYCKILTR